MVDAVQLSEVRPVIPLGHTEDAAAHMGKIIFNSTIQLLYIQVAESVVKLLWVDSGTL